MSIYELILNFLSFYFIEGFFLYYLFFLLKFLIICGWFWFGWFHWIQWGANNSIFFGLYLVSRVDTYAKDWTGVQVAVERYYYSDSGLYFAFVLFVFPCLNMGYLIKLFSLPSSDGDSHLEGRIRWMQRTLGTVRHSTGISGSKFYVISYVHGQSTIFKA